MFEVIVVVLEYDPNQARVMVRGAFHEDQPLPDPLHPDNTQNRVRVFANAIMSSHVGFSGLSPIESFVTPELKQMNRYWFMLSATLNELAIALNAGDYTPEERLSMVRALYDHMRSHMPLSVPPGVAAEALERETERADDEQETYYRRGADDTFEGPFTFTAEDGAPFTLEEEAIMKADWERDHAR